MQRAYRGGVAIATWLCTALFLGGCGQDEPCSGGSCAGAAAQTGGVGGTGGASGMGGEGGDAGMGGMGGSGGAQMEPPIMGPMPTACVPLIEAAAPTERVLYEGVEELHGLAHRRSDLFAWDATGIVRLSEGAMQLERVASAQVEEVMAADLRLYWSQGSTLFRIDFDADAGEPELVAMGLQSPPTLLRHDQTNVFYAHASSSSVWQQPIDGSAGTQLAMTAGVNDLLVHGGRLYIASGQSVRRVDLATDEISDVIAQAPRTVLDIETNGPQLVWSDGVAVCSVDLEDPQAPMALTQAGPSATGVGQSRIKQIVLQGSAVFFADTAGNLGSAALSGASCRLLHVGRGDVRGLVVPDGDNIFVNVRAAQSSELWAIAH